MINLGKPALTFILEFGDGKLMLTSSQAILGFTWDSLLAALGEDRVTGLLAGADIAAIGYWSAMPDFNHIIEQIAQISFKTGNPKRLFFDFADIKKCSETALLETMQALAPLNLHLPMTLSLNEHEADLLFAAFGCKFEANISALEAVRQKTGLYELVVHTPFFALAATESESDIVPQKHCEKTVRTVGAGDTFNGGYICAYAYHLGMRERLSVANAATRYFVEAGAAPDIEQILKEI